MLACDPRANAATAGSISAESRMLIALISIPNEGATDWIAPSRPNPVGAVVSRRTAARVTLGAISFSSSIHFALMPNSNSVNPVALPPGRARLATKPEPTGSLHEHDWYAAGGSQQWPHDRGAYGEDDFRRERNQFRRVGIASPGIDCAQAVVDLQVTSDVPSQFPKSLQERGVAGECLRVVRGQASEHADAPRTLGLLCARRERPRGRAAEKRDELAPFHSITSSARTRIPVGNSMPIALATLRLITSSNFDACSTGRSAGLVPLSTRAT